MNVVIGGGSRIAACIHQAAIGIGCRVVGKGKALVCGLDGAGAIILAIGWRQVILAGEETLEIKSLFLDLVTACRLLGLCASELLNESVKRSR